MADRDYDAVQRLEKEFMSNYPDGMSQRDHDLFWDSLGPSLDELFDESAADDARWDRDRRIVLVECGCCDCLHPIAFNGDCRDDANRYGTAEEYAQRNRVSIWDIEVMEPKGLDEDEMEKSRR